VNKWVVTHDLIFNLAGYYKMTSNFISSENDITVFKLLRVKRVCIESKGHAGDKEKKGEFGKG